MQLTNNSQDNINLIKELATKSFPTQEVLKNITITQAILESNLLNKPSRLAIEGNNLFGIKGTGTDGSITLPTAEYVNGKRIVIPQAFAKNKTLQDSIDQHKSLLNRPRYAKVLLAKTFEEAALQIRLAGYATDPAYTSLLIEIYKKNILQQ